MKENNIIRVESISQLFKMFGWDKPKHPLIGVIDIQQIDQLDIEAFEDVKVVSELYTIFMKDGNCGMQYGRNKFDFEEGVLQFIAPKQVFSTSGPYQKSTYGFMMVFHPDLIRNFELGRRIDDYTFFSYDVHEALHLSEKEERTMIGIAEQIQGELNENIDKHSQEVLVSSLQLFLNYSRRFYERQFITRTNAHSDVISQVEAKIKEYYKSNKQLEFGTPTPEYFAEQVNLSTNYLSDLLRKETGMTTKDHIDDHVINLAKTSLLNSEDTISEIAYDLGFNYPHYFSRLFKKKTGLTPNDYRSNLLN